MATLKLEDINLNLLVSLDALLEERNVTRAARRMGVTQSAMSHTLRRLRDLFEDELLVSGRDGMVLTPRAQRLAAPLHEELMELERVVRDEARFDPRTAERTFYLATSDYIAMVLVPAMLELLGDQAPGIDLVFRPMKFDRVSWQLETGELSMSVGVNLDLRAGIKRRKLFDDHFACLVRKDHPTIRGELTFERYLETPHALISPTSEGQGIVDRVLAEQGRARRVSLRVPFFAAAPFFIAQSDLILTAPRRLACMLASRFDLQLLCAPVELPHFDVFTAWHERFDGSPAHQWLRELTVQAAKRVEA